MNAGHATGAVVLDERPESLTIHRLGMSLRNEHRAAHGTVSERELILVEWTGRGGVVGWGECPALSHAGYVPETSDIAWESLRDVLGPAALLGRIDARASMAAASLADARLDAALRVAGVRGADWVTALLQDASEGRGRAAVPMCQVIGIDPEMIALRIEPGVTMVKGKISPDSIGRLPSLIDQLGGRVPLALDANGSFAAADEFPAWVDDVDVVFIEQPFAPGNEAMAMDLRRRGIRVAWDESVTGADSLERLASPGDSDSEHDRDERGAPSDVISIKPARAGGVANSLAWARRATELGLDWYVGGMLEGGMGRAAALAVASASSLPTDLGPSSRYFIDDVCVPITAADIGLIVPDGPGWGRVPDPERLAAVTIDRIRLG